MGAWDHTIGLFPSDNGTAATILVRGDGHDKTAAPRTGRDEARIASGRTSLPWPQLAPALAGDGSVTRDPVFVDHEVATKLSAGCRE